MTNDTKITSKQIEHFFPHHIFMFEIPTATFMNDNFSLYLN